MAALLDLVRKLIDYGKELAATLQNRAAREPLLQLSRFRHQGFDADPGEHHTRPASRHRFGIPLVPAARWPHSPERPRRPQPCNAGRVPAVRHFLGMRTCLSPSYPRPNRLPPRSAAGRSAPSSPISAVISVSSPTTRCGASAEGHHAPRRQLRPSAEGHHHAAISIVSRKSAAPCDPPAFPSSLTPACTGPP